ncbi:MAG: EAL domain-containing protein [Hyphomonadaceae bacterium]|nr:EAL domain-containing protein [Hyphomonadaceae bacterium]
MSPAAPVQTPMRPPLGLAGRAVLFVIGLVTLTATLATATVWYGANQESRRHQEMVARDLTRRFTDNVSAMIVDGEAARLPSMVERMAARDDVMRISLRDRDGQIIAESGRNPEDVRISTLLANRVNASGDVERMHAQGALAVGAPIFLNGQRIGAAVVMWSPDEFRFNTLLALTPFFLFLGCLMLAAVPIAAHFVRKAIAPLDELTQFARKVAEQGEPAPLVMKTGDEFETLAGAFNGMMERLDASMRRIQEIAFVDPVTQLPNQDRFLREVDFSISNARTSEEGGAVLVFEFQRLQAMMPALEPDAARELMRLVGERFANAARTVDKLMRARAGLNSAAAIVARIGASEFAIYSPSALTPTNAGRFAQQMASALNQPFDWRDHKLSLGVLCGVAISGRDGDDAYSTLRHARIALNAAQSAPAKVKLFTQSLDREAMARFNLEREMRGALERNEFRAHFQPKINLDTGRVEAAEALARWVRPDHTIVSPNRFIPLAEESGLIGPLSDAILREACWKAAAWARAGMPVKMAVNVSALQFRDERFPDRVLQILNHAGLPATALELEITESVAMEDPERARRLINKLREAGVRFAIDDFGCGHSSLAALSKLPFDVVKIDQQFIRALDNGDAQSAAIIEMILALAGALDLEVVAEGVERREHVEFVAARGCRWVQGFHYGAAMPAAEFAETLRRQEEDTRTRGAA